GRSRDARRWKLGDRQSGNLWPTGRSAVSTVRRSGGKEKPNWVSIRANSMSDRLGWTPTKEDWRWVTTLLASGERYETVARWKRVRECGGDGSSREAA
ncbi:hypothetical protein LINPERPRIM_LOCUS25274, partial [Linum perenne]